LLFLERLILLMKEYIQSTSSQCYPFNLGRAIAQAVSRLFLNAAAWVRFQVKSCGICGGQSGAGAVFLRVLLFPLSSSLSTNCSTLIHLSSGAGTRGQLVADVPSGLSLTPPQET
jgi:hypothetical protein